MAVEFDLQSDADVSSAELHAFFADALAGELSQDGTVFRPGMYVMSRQVTPDDEDTTTQLFGFDHRVNATYRFANLSEEAERDHNTVVMARSVLAFAQRFGGRGVLLFNGDRAVMQWDSADVVFDSHWEDWSELEDAVPLVAKHARRPLSQPLL